MTTVPSPQIREARRQKHTHYFLSGEKNELGSQNSILSKMSFRMTVK